MPFEPDLARYFERIRYRGAVAPTLENLNAIILAHLRHIPFENVDVLLGRGIELAPERIERKLIAEGRGGYCFEQNTYFCHVLEALGFRVGTLAARVRLGRPRGVVAPRTHLFLRVELPEGSFLVDVGVGGLSPTCALHLTLDVVQQTPHEPRRLVHEGEWDGFQLRAPDAKLYHQVQLEGAWQDVCELTLEDMPEFDREIGNWYTSTHPASHFRHLLLVALATERGRRTLLNRRFTRREGDRAEVHEVATEHELLELLDREFNIRLPAGTRLTCAGLDWPKKG
jgi:N-hydroxyarylamine O-acetyltransferase